MNHKYDVHGTMLWTVNCLETSRRKGPFAEALKTARGNNLVQARLTDAMDNAHKVQQQNEKLREELVQVHLYAC